MASYTAQFGLESNLKGRQIISAEKSSRSKNKPRSWWFWELWKFEEDAGEYENIEDELWKVTVCIEREFYNSEESKEAQNDQVDYKV